MHVAKTTEMKLLDRDFLYYNQHSKDWTHPYEWDGKGNLATSGCGIFSLCHALEWLTGNRPSAEEWADFSKANGGRGDDGTDRPALLHALQISGEAEKYGFSYAEDGLRNDLDTLYDFLLHERGVAFCNLRVGHIVTLVAAREQDGIRQVLAIDSCAESASERVRDHVIEVLAGTEVTAPVRNARGLEVGSITSHAAFWVEASLPCDFNLLRRL